MKSQKLKFIKNISGNLFTLFFVALFLISQIGVYSAYAQEIPSAEPEEGETGETPTPTESISETPETENTPTPEVFEEIPEEPTDISLMVPADIQVGLDEDLVVKLTWSMTDENTTAYSIERGTNDSDEWLTLTSLETDIFEYTDSTVDCGNTYQYRIQAYSSEFDTYSEYSEQVSISMEDCPTETPGLLSIEKFDFSGFENLASIAGENGTVRVIVQLDTSFQAEGLLPGLSAVQSQRNTINSAQQRVLDQISTENVVSSRQFETIPFMSLEVDQEGLAGLINSPGVISIMENKPVPANLDLSVPRIGGDAARNAGYDGSGWTVAIIDTGVDKTHPFLSGKVVSEACYSTNAYYYGRQYSFSTCPGGVELSIATGSGVNCSTSIEGCEHGTHVAGIAVGSNANMYGVAPGADIISIKVFSKFDPNYCPENNYTHSCVMAWDDDIISGLERVLRLHNNTSLNIASVNLSLGGEKFTSYCDSSMSVYKTIIDNLKSVGIATIVASGNEAYTNALSAPACISSAVSVGATTDSDTVDSYSNSASFLDLLAPGSSIYSSVPDTRYESWSGTSMAAPHVAGAWAVMRQRFPTATVDEILGNLTNTGVMIRDSRNGITKPRIQLDEALYLPSVTLNDGMYDDGNEAVVFFGNWFTSYPKQAYGGSFHYSKLLGQEALFSFSGKQFSLIYTKASYFGQMQIYVDGNLVATLDQSNSEVLNQQHWNSADLGDGTHLVHLVQATSSLINLDGFIVHDEVVGQTLSTGKYDEQNPAFIYSGDWKTSTPALAYQGGILYSNVINQSVSIKFSGVQASLIYTAAPYFGSVRVYIDGSYMDTISQNSSETKHQQQWHSAVLSEGEHTIQFFQNSSSLINIDGLVVHDVEAGKTISAGIYNDKDPAITYIGNWKTSYPSYSYKFSFQYSTTLKDEAIFTFTGVQLSLIYTQAPFCGSIQIYIDDVLQDTLNQYGTVTTYQQQWHSAVLSNGVHTVRLVHSSHPLATIDGVIIHDQPIAQILETGSYDDDNSDIVYIGIGWNTSNNINAYGGSFAYSGTPSQEINFRFEGTQVSLIYTSGSYGGTADIYIDNVLQTTLNIYSANQQYQQRWDSAIFSNGVHSVKIKQITRPIITLDGVIISE